MSTEHFTVQEHISPSQHIRGYPHTVKEDDAVLRLSVKEYIPRRKLSQVQAETAVTIIAAGGNGFPKETYQPLWDAVLLAESQHANFHIRSVWIADVANQGASYALNSDKLGDDPNWLDHSRDLLLMMNVFRHKMIPPFVGVGHSMGGAQIAHLAHLHPRLLTSVIIIDPVILTFAPPGPNAALMSSYRRSTFPSRQIAESGFRRNPFFRSFHPEALNAYLEYGLTDAGSGDGSVKLATPKAQEAWSYVRATFHPLPLDESTPEARDQERWLNPELVPFDGASKTVFVRPESTLVAEFLPYLRPRALFVFGEDSYINGEEVREGLMRSTGIGRGGNGGVADGGVEMKVLEDIGHTCCFEKPGLVGKEIVRWLDKEAVRWKAEKEFWKNYDRAVSVDSGTTLSKKWMANVREDALLQRPVQGQKAQL